MGRCVRAACVLARSVAWRRDRSAACRSVPTPTSGDLEIAVGSLLLLCCLPFALIWTYRVLVSWGLWCCGIRGRCATVTAPSFVSHAKR